MTRTLRRRHSLITHVTRWRRRIPRCTFPACSHVVGTFPAPRHLTGPRCAGITWWHGCAAWLAGHCTCPGCVPVETVGAGTGSPCQCPPATPVDVV